MNKYTTLIFDLDGTAIPNIETGMPTGTLIRVIQKLKKSMKVCAATGRPFYKSQPILQALKLTDPCVISGGTQIIDPVSGEVLWEKNMTDKQVDQIINLAKEYPYRVYWSDDKEVTSGYEKINNRSERIIYFIAVTQDDTAIILDILHMIPDISAHEVMSWTPRYFDIHITHSEATKKYALEELFKILGVEKKEVVVAGDSNNDLPLFEMAGYKIAMENGSDEIKSRADIIAPRADKDGLAIVLANLSRSRML